MFLQIRGNRHQLKVRTVFIIVYESVASEAKLGDAVQALNNSKTDNRRRGRRTCIVGTYCVGWGLRQGFLTCAAHHCIRQTTYVSCLKL
jgi:hypothetical protein